MNWLNLRISVVRAPEYVGSEPVQRATWFNVLAYCAEQENGGRIVGARGWKDRRWQQTCGVTLKEVETAAPLLRWEKDDLIVWAYPADKESEVQAKREGGRKKPPASPPRPANSDGNSVPSSVDNSAGNTVSTERKEGEREGKEAEVRALHETYRGLTGYEATLSPDRMRAWGEFMARGYSDEDLKRVVHFIRKGMNDGGKFDERSLQFTVLVGDLGKFEERLLMAKKTALTPAVKKLPNPADVYRVPANGSE